MDIISNILEVILYQILMRVHGLCSFVCWIVQTIYETFAMFAGATPVEYEGERTFLLNVFFNNPAISSLYWGMAAIGIVLCFVFALVAVIRKMFDSEDKMQTTMGAIVGSMIKSMLLIMSLNFIMVAVLNMTNVVIQQVEYVFTDASIQSERAERTITFTEEDYATMARIYNTIGNHAINASYEGRLNINSCFNEIRQDMLILENKGVFDFNYDKNDYGDVPENWQSVLVSIARARTLTSEMPIDEYNQKVADSILYAMEVLQSGRDFAPLSSFKPPSEAHVVSGKTKLDALIMMTGTLEAADNEKYNENASITDALRWPYMTGEKSYWLYPVMAVDFNIIEVNFLMILITALFLAYHFILIAINAVARIFNIILLYLAAPPIIAASPLDGGGKLKQWITAFTIQSLSIIGSLMSMRLVTFFMPIIYDDSLVFFPDEGYLANNAVRNYLIRLFFVIAVAYTANKSISMISGILADSAGWQSIQAGNVGDGLMKEVQEDYATAKKAATMVADIYSGGAASAAEGAAALGSAGEGAAAASGGGGAGPTNMSNVGGTEGGGNGGDTQQTNESGMGNENEDTGGENLGNNLGNTLDQSNNSNIGDGQGTDPNAQTPPDTNNTGNTINNKQGADETGPDQTNNNVGQQGADGTNGVHGTTGSQGTNGTNGTGANPQNHAGTVTGNTENGAGGKDLANLNTEEKKKPTKVPPIPPTNHNKRS